MLFLTSIIKWILCHIKSRQWNRHFFVSMSNLFWKITELDFASGWQRRYLCPGLDPSSILSKISVFPCLYQVPCRWVSERIHSFSKCLLIAYYAQGSRLSLLDSKVNWIDKLPCSCRLHTFNQSQVANCNEHHVSPDRVSQHLTFAAPAF